MQIQNHKNNMQKILGTIMKILSAMMTWHPGFVQACYKAFNASHNKCLIQWAESNYTEEMGMMPLHQPLDKLLTILSVS
jgi:hypothetical protein